MVKGFMAAILTVATLAGALMLLDTPTVSADEHKVEICHRRNAVNNAYGPKKIEIAKQAIFKQGHDTHTGPVATSAVVAQQLKDSQIEWGDIIPPFEYKDKGQTQQYAGMNWTAEGQAIWNNNCQYLVETSPDIQFRVNCDRQDRVRVILRNQGTAEGSITVNGIVHTLAIGERKVVRFDADTRVVIILDGQTVYDEVVTCNDATPLSPNTVFQGACVEATQSFVLTFTNTGNKESLAVVNGQNVTIPADGKGVEVAVKTGATPTQISVVLDGKTVLETTKVCIQGQGNVQEIPKTPALPTGGSGAAVGDVTSLPVTSGASDQLAALVVMIGSILATAGGYALRARSGELSI